MIRRITSPTRWPWFSAWYPEAVPGSHHGSCRASIDVDFSQSYRSSTTTGCAHPDTPDVCDMRCRTSMSALPFCANSGQYFETFANGSSSPRSTSTSALRYVIVFVDDHTFVIVFSAHGFVFSVSAQPPHMSTTSWPSSVTATDAPRSAPESMLPESSSLIAVNRSSHLP